MKSYKYKTIKRKSKNSELALAGILLGLGIVAISSIHKKQKPTDKEAKRLFNLLIRNLILL